MKINQLLPMRIALGVVLVCSSLLASCQREIVDPSRLEIVAEGFQGTKMIVDGPTAQWSNGDVVCINGEDKTITVSGSSAYVTDVVSASEYCAIFPASIVSGSISGTSATVTLPSEYRYREDASGNQILDAPMMAYRTGNGRLEFKHLTAALVVEIDADGYTSLPNRLDSIIITSDVGKLCGSMAVDFTDLDATTAATTSDVDNSVCMVFDDFSRFYANSDYGVKIAGGDWGGKMSIQIPVRAVSEQHFTVRVVAHRHDRDGVHVFERTQTTATGIGRNEIGYVKVDFKTGATGYSVRERRLTTLPDGSYAVCDRTGLGAMMDLIRRGTDSESYRTAKYTITQNIDATGITTQPIRLKNGAVINGGGHAISNLTVATVDGPVGLIWHDGGTVTVNGLTLKDITVSKVGDEGNTTVFAPFVGSCSNNAYNKLRLINCHTDGMTVLGVKKWEYCELRVGGLVGGVYGDMRLVMKNCSFMGTLNLEHDYRMANPTVAIFFGGLVGAISGAGNGKTDTITGCSVNMYVTLSSIYTVRAGGLVGELCPSNGQDTVISSGNVLVGRLDVTGDAESSVADTAGYVRGPLSADCGRWMEDVNHHTNSTGFTYTLNN